MDTLLTTKLLSIVEYGVSNPTEYGVSSSLSNTVYSSQQINTAYPLPLDTAYRSSRTETKKRFSCKTISTFLSSDFNLLSDKDNAEEEEEEARAKQMRIHEQDQNRQIGVARPKIYNKDQFELKGQLLRSFEKTHLAVRIMKMLMNTLRKFLCLKRCTFPTKTAADAKTAIQEMLNTLKNGTMEHQEEEVGCEQCKGPHYTKDCPQKKKVKEEGKTLEEAYYTQFGGPFQGGGYRAAALGFYQRNNANPSYQERRQSIEDTLRKFMSESAKRHEENSNLIKEIRASTDTAIQNQGASIKTLEIQIGKEKDPGSFTLPCFINNVCFDNGLVDLGASVSVMPLSTYLNLRLGELAHTKLTVELADRTVNYPNEIAENVLVGIVRAKIDVYKRKITLRVREERIVFTRVKPASSLIKRVYMLSLRERMELDFEARLLGETLVLNRSLDPLFEDYIKLNDLNEPFELRRNQGDDLIPTIEEGGVIEEFRTRDDELDDRIDGYPSYCDYDKKIHIDCAYNLKFSCMIGFEFTHANFFPLLYVNVMSKKFHNSIIKDKMVYKGNNVVGALMNVPIFVRTFSVMTDFEVLE
ncbi:hypothetical protein Tco_0906050, partial [Tanacetum coccineum]